MDGINDKRITPERFQPFHESPGSRLFRSACSGLWYRNPAAAGEIDGVELYGKRIFRNDDEETLEWVHRVADWASEIHSANVESTREGRQKP